MNGLDNFDREQLETWITMCDEKLDKLKVPDNYGGALLSISGRLGSYIESNEAELEKLRDFVTAVEETLELHPSHWESQLKSELAKTKAATAEKAG